MDLVAAEVDEVLGEDLADFVEEPLEEFKIRLVSRVDEIGQMGRVSVLVVTLRQQTLDTMPGARVTWSLVVAKMEPGVSNSTMTRMPQSLACSITSATSTRL